jgi:hypothetical protein
MRRPEAALPVERPQITVSVAGAEMPGVSTMALMAVGYAAADRFRVGFALDASNGADVAFYTVLAGQPVTINVATGGFGFATLLVGVVDNVRIDLFTNVAELSGRDLTALMIDAEISMAYVNQTASQIAETIAQLHGLTPVVTPTSTLVGQYYERDHARNALGLHSRATTEWNLLVTLAQAEGFAVDVVGQSLIFGPAADTVPVLVTAQNFMKLDLDYAAALPGGVAVKSWNARDKAVNQAAAGAGMQTSVIRPNLSLAQAQSLATMHFGAVAGQALVLAGTMPGDVSLMPGGLLQLSGTGSVFDTGYAVVSVARSLGAAGGFRQSVRGYAALN